MIKHEKTAFLHQIEQKSHLARRTAPSTPSFEIYRDPDVPATPASNNNSGLGAQTSVRKKLLWSQRALKTRKVTPEVESFLGQDRSFIHSQTSKTHQEMVINYGDDNRNVVSLYSFLLLVFF